MTALYAACKVGQSVCVTLLLEARAAVDEPFGAGCTPLYGACQEGQDDCAKVLIKYGATINQANDRGETPLYIACQKGRTPCVRTLLDAAADMHLADKDGCLPLTLASEFGHLDIVRLMLAAGACEMTEPLRMACQVGQVGSVRLLLQAGALTDPPGHKTPLHVACLQGHEACVEALIDAKANVNAVQGYSTPLMFACYRGRLGCAHALVDAGADISLRVRGGDGERLTALDWALQGGDEKCIAFIRKRQPKRFGILALHGPNGEEITIGVPGERVKLRGLQARADLNGRVGTLVTYSVERERFGVRIENGDAEPIAIKLANLDFFEATEDASSVMDSVVGT